MGNLDSLYNNLEKQYETYQKLLVLQNNVLVALSSNNIPELDKFLKEEQAFVLKVRSLEQQRLKIANESGCADLRLKEIIERLDGEDKNRFTLMYDKISATLKQIKALNKNSKTIIESRLHSIEVATNGKQTYSKDGVVPANSELKYRYNNKV